MLSSPSSRLFPRGLGCWASSKEVVGWLDCFLVLLGHMFLLRYSLMIFPIQDTSILFVQYPTKKSEHDFNFLKHLVREK
jgi:hypothetical protein